MVSNWSTDILIIVNNIYFIQQPQIFYLNIYIHQLIERNIIPHYSKNYIRSFSLVTFSS